MKKKVIKIKLKNIFILTAFLLCFIGVSISIFKVIKWKIESDKTKNQINDIESNVAVDEIEDGDNTELINPPEENKPNPYWDYIKMKLINVDFSELKQTNKEVKGWIQVNGTNINYPFVQTSNNDYYLTHSFDKSYNDAGWVFMDYRNNIDEMSKNTILYAHGRLDTTMFGSLKNIVKSNWYSDSNNYVIKLSTEKENTLWQVFSVYHIKTTNDYIAVDFINDIEYQNLLDKLKNRSVYEFNVEVNSNDKILTLSTCYNKTEKVVMHAKLIKKSVR